MKGGGGGEHVSDIRIVTDSGADLDAELCAAEGIHVVPLTITFDQEEYQDGVDLTPNAFYGKLRESKTMPFTTQPSPAEFVRTYEQLRDQGATHIISIHLSSRLSGTVQSAALAAREVSGVNIEVIDSLSASLGIGMLAMEAARRSRSGEAFEAIVEAVRAMIPRLKIYFVVDTLEYLAKNGRIGKAQALLGGILNVKPVLTLEDGVVSPVGKARGKNRAHSMVVERFKEAVGGQAVRGAIVHGAAPEDAQRLKELIEAACPGSQLSVHLLGPTIGTHAGPGTLGVVGIAP